MYTSLFPVFVFNFLGVGKCIIRMTCYVCFFFHSNLDSPNLLVKRIFFCRYDHISTQFTAYIKNKADRQLRDGNCYVKSQAQRLEG